MSARAKTLAREGHPIIALSAGEPDFDTPGPVAEAGIAAIQQGFTRYTHNQGIPELREAICAKLRRDNALDYTPEQILCSNGAKQSVAMAITVLCAEGDEVLIPAPYWVSYPEMTRFAGATPVVMPTSVDSDYRITAAMLEAAITDRTRVLVMCSPSNPTGSVYPRHELDAIATVLQQHKNIHVVSDEIYEHVIYDAEHVAMASLPNMKERTITVNGFSKSYAMTGWRLGYMAGPVAVIKNAAKVQSQLTSAPSSITQQAGIAALQMGMEPIRTMVRAFRSRRDYVLERLNAIEGVICPKPEGAFYLFPDVSAFYGRKSPGGRVISDSQTLGFYLLEEHHVALVPGQAFGDPCGIRLSYATSMNELKEALNRIEKALAALT